ncbi:MAG: sugar transferase [Albidovulum sp.]
MSAPLFEFRETIAEIDPSRFYPAYGKRLFDLSAIVMMAPIILPLMLFIFVSGALFGGRPLYSQIRVGRDGRLFRCWKFRTMVPDADKALGRILRENPDLAEEWQDTQKLRLDPRITPVGRILRRTSLDELPQLWNVLCGTMSLVGPRPFLPEQRHLYHNGRCDVGYYQMFPGITGLWQVSRRNRGSFAERAVYDGEYRDMLGFWSDLSILIRTVFVVTRATGV